VKAVKETPSKRRTAMSTLSMLKFRASIFAAVLTLAPFSPASHAQDGGTVAQVNVPFAFNTASQHYAPGMYRIHMQNEYTLLIQGASESHLAIVRTEDNSQTVKTGKAVFHKYGDQYFLSEITVQGTNRHVYLTPSKREREERIAQNKKAPAGVELSLLQNAR
jgi:hypothetical protein